MIGSMVVLERESKAWTWWQLYLVFEQVKSLYGKGLGENPGKIFKHCGKA